MNDKMSLRIWRNEGIGEFLHVSNFAHPNSKVLHQSLDICFVEKGAYRVNHCGVTHSVGEGALLVVQSGEFTSCEDFEGRAKYRVFLQRHQRDGDNCRRNRGPIQRETNLSESVYL